MKIQFKVQPYQTEAVNAVLECFIGQPYQDAFSYRIDPGSTKATHPTQQAIDYNAAGTQSAEHGFRNQDIRLATNKLLENIQQVQKQQNLFQSIH